MGTPFGDTSWAIIAVAAGTGLNAVWPGENWAILVVEEAGKAWYVTEELKKMKRRREIHRAGLRAFVQDGEIMV